VLREGELAARRAAFGADARSAFWRSCGFDPPSAGALMVSLFSYAGAPITPLLTCWEQGDEPVVAAVRKTDGRPVRDTVASWIERPGSACGVAPSKMRILPF
jgi:hypothetical protein